MISSVEAVKKLTYVDSNCIGLQGHSYGGFETNYLITKTNLFAAAASSCGKANYISSSGTLKAGIYDSHDDEVYGQSFLGVSLWQNPDVYIKKFSTLWRR